MKLYMDMSLKQRRQYKLEEIMTEANIFKEVKRKNEELRDILRKEEQQQNKSKCDFIKAQQLLNEEKMRALEVLTIYLENL